jgi:sodium pump decarboxylase gamma subunit
MTLLWQALTIMSLGMALVFFFLFALVQCVLLSARIVQRFEKPEDAGAGAPATGTGPDLATVAAAVAVALAETHRGK